MTRFAGLLVAGGMMLASASTADAQVSISLGNPYGYGGRGVVIGNPGYGYAAPYGYGTTYAAPATTVYNSGYSGYAAPYTGYSTTTYVAPSYGYAPVVPSYGYAPYRSYGYRAPAYGTVYRGYGYGRGVGGLGRGFRFR